MARKTPNLKTLQAECDAFNAKCEIGGPVRLKVDGSVEPLYTTTRSAAQIMSGHSSVVWMNGVSGSYLLSHVTPITAAEAELGAKQQEERANASAEMTDEQMLTRINLLSSEMDANDEENREMQKEINSLYAKIDAKKVAA